MSLPSIPHFVIIGGGIAGLAAAYRLEELSREREQPIRITLLEAGNCLGGTVATEARDGFLLELGPDSFISEKPWALALCQRIGLEPELIRTRDEYRTTFIVHRGRLEPLPEGFMLLAPTRFGPLVRSSLFSWWGKVRMGLDLLLPRATGQEDESLGSFVRRRLGREALERVAQPLIGGIYTADPDHLSLAATMPRFLQMEREHRSVIYTMWQAGRKQPQVAKGTSGARWSLFVTLRKGMQQFVDTLADRLSLSEVHRHCTVSAIRPVGRQWVIECEKGEPLRADGVILATPAFQTVHLVQDFDAQIAGLLSHISYSSAATVNLAYRREHIPHSLNGFGFVVPRVENRGILACTFSSVKYPGRAPDGHALLRVFVGGSLQQEMFDLEDQAMAKMVRQELGQLLGIQVAPLFVRITRYPRSMPQYMVGHLGLVSEIEKKVSQYPSLALAGSAYRGVGIADCVHSGEIAAETMVKGISMERSVLSPTDPS